MLQKKDNSSRIVLILYYISRFIYYFQAFYLLRYWLEREERGVYGLVKSTAFLFGQLDLGDAILRYFPYFRHSKKRKAALLGWVILLNSIIYVLLLLLFCMWNSRFDGNASAFIPLIFTKGYLVLLSVLLKSWFSVLRRVVWPNFVQHIIFNLLTIGCFYAYYRFDFSFDNLLLLTLVPNVVHLLLLLGRLYWLGELSISWERRFLPPGFFRSFLLYGFFVLPVSHCFSILMRMDTWMVGQYLGWGVAATYVALLKLTLFIDVPRKVSKQFILPRLSHLLAKENYKKANEVYKRQVTEQFFISSVTFFFLYLNWSWYLVYLPDLTTDLKEMFQVFVLLGCAKVCYNVFYSSIKLLLLSRHYLYSSINLLGFFVGLKTIEWFVQMYGIWGAALGILSFTLLWGLGNMFLVWYTVRLNPLSFPMLYVLPLALLLFFLKDLVIFGLPFLDYALQNVLLGGAYVYIRRAQRSYFLRQKDY